MTTRRCCTADHLSALATRSARHVDRQRLCAPVACMACAAVSGHRARSPNKKRDLCIQFPRVAHRQFIVTTRHRSASSARDSPPGDSSPLRTVGGRLGAHISGNRATRTRITRDMNSVADDFRTIRARVMVCVTTGLPGACSGTHHSAQRAPTHPARPRTLCPPPAACAASTCSSGRHPPTCMASMHTNPRQPHCQSRTVLNRRLNSLSRSAPMPRR